MWLKRTTPQNIVIGGAAGCVPVLVAWAAVTGEVGLPALVLFAIVFYWTPPHFWALALRYRGDYAAANVPMLPVVRGEAETARQIVLYTDRPGRRQPAPAAGGRDGLGLPGRRGRARRRSSCSTRSAFGPMRPTAAPRSACSATRSRYLTLLFAAVAVDALLPPAARLA